MEFGYKIRIKAIKTAYPPTLKSKNPVILTLEIIRQRCSGSKNVRPANRRTNFNGRFQHNPQRQILRPGRSNKESVQPQHQLATPRIVQQRGQHAGQIPTSQHRPHDRCDNQTPTAMPGNVVGQGGDTFRYCSQEKGQFK